MRSDTSHAALLYLDAEEIGSHCNRDGTVDHVPLLQQRAISNPARPLSYLSLFELCHRLYFGVHYGSLEPVPFAACWSRFVAAHHEVAAEFDGHLIWLSHDLPASLQPPLLPYVLELSPRRSTPRLDRRGPDNDYQAHCERMRAIARHQCKAVAHGLGQLATAVASWGGPAPRELRAISAIRDLPAQASGTRDLVLDSNVAIELFNQLTPSGELPELPMRGDRALAGAVRDRVHQALDTRGLSGRIIVPLTTLEESHNIGSHKADVYPRLLSQLAGMDDPARDSWLEAFTFEDVSFEVFEALWCLLSELRTHASRSPGGVALGLPSFTDCMVLAHGLAHRCWVASAEWTDKNDWDPVKSLYPWLVPSVNGGGMESHALHKLT